MALLTLQRVVTGNLPVLENLMQLYLYDFSQYFCGDTDGYVDDSGLFTLDYALKRYADGVNDKGDSFEAYLAKSGRNWAGFVLISDRADFAKRLGAAGGHNIDEFFVLRCFRRRGFGRELARAAFDTHTGFWQIAQVWDNKPAQAFWRNVIRTYTGGRFSEEVIEEYGEKLVWQFFNSSSW